MQLPLFKPEPKMPAHYACSTASFRLRYQWQFNGNDVPNATNAMFLINSAQTTNAGDYRVTVFSSAGGANTSSVARLIVSTDPPPVVYALAPQVFGQFRFQLSGEEGRSYEVDVSTNLTDWIRRWSSPYSRFVVHNTNTTTIFQFASDGPVRFFKLIPYHPENELCNLNLKQLRFAVWEYAEDHHKEGYDSVGKSDAEPYLIGSKWPKCPLFPSDYPIDNYYIAWVNGLPTCIVNHPLEEP